MALIKEIHAWNIHFCFFLGIMFNFATIWLITKKSPKEMQFYSRILLQTTIVDIAMATSAELLHPMLIVYKNETIFYLDGPLARAMPYTIAQFLLASLQGLIINFSVFGQAVQFLYRYLVLNRGVKISIAGYLSMLLVNPFIMIFLTILFAIGGYPTDNKRFMEDEIIAELISRSADRHPLLAIRTDTNQMLSAINATVFNLANVICYVIIIVCGIKMVKFIRKNAIKSKKHDLEKQLTRSLIAMAIPPFLSLCSNLLLTTSLVIFSKILMSDDSGQLDQLIVSVQIGFIIPITWICVLNPLIVIWTIKRYRKAVIDMIRNMMQLAQ